MSVKEFLVKYRQLFFCFVLIIYFLCGVALYGFSRFGANLFFDRSGSLYPFLYSLAAVLVIYLPWMYFSRRFVRLSTCVAVAFWYLILSLLVWTILLFFSIEIGWNFFVFIYALMFYPAKYIFISNVLLFYFVIKYSLLRENEEEHKVANERILAFFLFLYLCLAACVPSLLASKGIKVLANVQTKPLVFNCSVSEDILETKKCIDETIYKREQSLDVKIAKKVKHPAVTGRPKFFDEGFIEKEIKKLSAFESIKECYAKDGCIKALPKGEPNLKRVLKYDEYGDVYIWVDSYSSFGEKDGKGLYLSLSFSGRLWNIGNVKSYPPAFFARKRDVVIIKRQSKEEVFVVGSEYIRLTNEAVSQPKDEFFVVISVLRFSGLTQNEYDDYFLDYQEGYKIYTSCSGANCFDADINISTDKREDPTALYVRFGEEAFEIKDVF